MEKLGKIFMGAAVAIAAMGQAQAINIDSWTGEGSYGTLGADGVVGLAPVTGTTQYGWVSTSNGIEGLGLDGIGGSGSATTGSKITSNLFSASAGDSLEFFFNYVTSDGAGFADYGWARLLNEDMSQAALLFTARTTPGGDTVPGFGMPTPEATLSPNSTPIIAGGPAWSPLATDSGDCWSTGCGYTGWIQANYNIATTGNYFLEIGAVNWDDSAYQTGMAFDGATIGGVDISVPVSEPGILALLAMGVVGLFSSRRRLAK